MRGSSRRPSFIKLEEMSAPPTSGIEDGRFVVRGHFDRGGVTQELTVTLDREGQIVGRWS